MKLSFSERLGLRNKNTLSKEELSDELRNALWSIFIETFFSKRNVIQSHNRRKLSELSEFYKDLWMDFFRRPIDELEITLGEIYPNKHYTFVRNWFFNAKWNDAYDLLEYCANLDDYDAITFKEKCNEYLKRDLAAFRFIDDQLVEINSEEEIIEIEKALNNSDKFKPIKAHLTAALNSMSHGSTDYRNSVKESISAVESCCNILLNSTKTLGQALKQIEANFHIPRGIKNGFSSIYGYASHEDGIRHGLTEEANNVGIEEARFMLITCSAFINYLLSKSST
jgi:hypothetical protein